MKTPNRNAVTKATASIVLPIEKRQRKDGTYPVCLRVWFEKKYQYWSLKYYVTKEDWEKKNLERPRKEARDLREKVDAWQKRADAIIDELPEFTFELFKRKYFGATRDEKDVFAAYETVIEELRENSQIGTAINYECAKASLKDYSSRKKIPELKFANVTPGFLKRYERWMLEEEHDEEGTGTHKLRRKKKCSPTTVSMYLRTLRTLFNRAISTGVISRDLYPFGKYKYEVSGQQNVKKVLTIADLSKLMNYIGQEGSREQWARDMWVFSFDSCGINITDIAHLKYKNVDFNSLTIKYIREKTKRTTRRNLKPIRASITSEMGRIIDKYGVKPITPETYVFDFLIGYDTPERQLKRVKDITKQINKYIDRIAKTLEIEMKVTSYVSRHTWSTIMRDLGYSRGIIGEQLGHSISRTTDGYVGSLPAELIHEIPISIHRYLNKMESEK